MKTNMTKQMVAAAVVLSTVFGAVAMTQANQVQAMTIVNSANAVANKLDKHVELGPLGNSYGTTGKTECKESSSSGLTKNMTPDGLAPLSWTQGKIYMG